MAALKPTEATSAASESKANDAQDSSQAPSLSTLAKFKFEAPSKRIATPVDIGKFLSSPTYNKLVRFLQELSESVKSTTISDCNPKSASDSVTKLMSMLQSIDKLIDEVAPLQTPSRYGNQAYRLWQDKLKQNASTLISSLLPSTWISDNEHSSVLESIVSELSGYLLGSFGDYTRIDYGTGHELTFICFILVLKELNVVTSNDYPSLILLVFVRYITLMRKLQMKYGLEPAGTKGVWGLDDYQFLPFYFGAAQLIAHTTIKPKDILNQDVLTEYSDDYMYLSSIQFILKVKTGPFPEHSPLLFDISGVPFWHKVRGGLLKMYQDDVLKKFPVIQHFLFGSILSVDLPKNDSKSPEGSEQEQLLKRKQALIGKLNAQRAKKQ